MGESTADGGCYCGEVRYRIYGQPRITTMCHCVDCRRAAGAQSVAWFTVPNEAFEWLQGDPIHFRSSPPVVRTFCGRCGTSLTYADEGRAGEIDVTTGSLDDPEAFPPVKEVFVEQKVSWA